MIPASSWVSRFTEMKMDKPTVPFDKVYDFDSAVEIVRAIQEDALRNSYNHTDQGQDGVNR